MITLHIIDIHFEPNNTFPHIWILHVALFDPIGSPLLLIMKLRQKTPVAAKRRFTRPTTVAQVTGPPLSMWSTRMSTCSRLHKTDQAGFLLTRFYRDTDLIEPLK